MSGNRKSAEPSSPGIPAWIVTFADLSTLLLTFFVLLLSFSNQDLVKFREMLGSVQGAFGMIVRKEGEFVSKVIPEENQQEQVDEEESEIDKKTVRQLEQEIVDNIDREDMKDISFLPGKNSVKVRITGSLLFAPGSVKINEQGLKMIDSISAAHKKLGLTLDVEGHTDNVPIRSIKYKDNWELSAHRASALVRYFILKGSDPKLLAATGYGDSIPIASNETEDGRAKNRRVEFLFKNYQ